MLKTRKICLFLPYLLGFIWYKYLPVKVILPSWSPLTHFAFKMILNILCIFHKGARNGLYGTKSAGEFLQKEGLINKSVFTGDPRYDVFLRYSKIAEYKDIKDIPEKYYYLTCHREENTSIATLKQILDAMNSLDAPTIYPVHPRNTENARQIVNANNYKNIVLTPPVGYITSLALIHGAEKIVTDSGGLQLEAFFAKKQCLFLFDYVIAPETMTGNRNQLTKREKTDILSKLFMPMTIDKNYMPYGDGNAAEKIVTAINCFFEENK